MSSSTSEAKGPAHSETAHEQALVELFEDMGPEPAQVARMETGLRQWIEQTEKKSLAAEWLDLLRVRPLATPSLALAGCLAMLVLSPLPGLLAFLYQ